MKELNNVEIEQVSGGDQMTHEWGVMAGALVRNGALYFMWGGYMLR